MIPRKNRSSIEKISRGSFFDCFLEGNIFDQARKSFTVNHLRFHSFDTIIKKFHKNETIATILTVGYISTWYFQINIFVCGDVGESLAMAFFPLALVASKNLLKNSNGSWILTVAAYTGLIQSHILLEKF